MINLYAKDELGTSIATITAIAVLAATLVYMVFVPAPSSKGIQQAQRRQENEILTTTEDSRAKLANAEKTINSVVWIQSADHIGPAALAKITALARANGVKLNGFRPQRSTSEESLETLPYVVSAEGPFPNVLEFIRAVETPTHKLAINLLQFTSSDSESDRVTATLGIIAFRRLSETEANRG